MDRMNLTDLVPNLLGDDDECITVLVDMALPRLAAIACGVGANADDAEEIALDTVFETLKHLDRLNLNRAHASDPLFSYMAKAAKNGARESYRKAQAERHALARATNATPGSPVYSQRDEDRGRLLWAHVRERQGGDPEPGSPSLLDSLSETDRQIVQLRVHTTLTWDEIAEEVSMNSPQVRKRWERIRGRLQRAARPEV